MGVRRVWVAGLLLCCATLSLRASGPRYVTGPPFFTGPAGVAIGWRQANLLYSTDPGDLGPKVNHAAADALVAAAAGVWNVPVASITVGEGNALAEHVSGQNVYLSTAGMMWPADVMSGNAAAVPVAVVYDTDGSVTDMLLGSGASDPSGCGQNAVTESVDAFDPAGYILHAIIVLNGRCTGAAPEQQEQMRYQLERVFGRVLGLAWSQTNDNVFTGVPQPNFDQAAHWPIMHPLDVLCGPYSFQCLPNPFTLRPDDVAGLVGIYPIAAGRTPAAGKQVSLTDANPVNGTITFPTGEGMAGVNVLVQRTPRFSPTPQDWFETSAVSGSGFRREGTSPFRAGDGSVEESFGSVGAQSQGFFVIPYFQVIDPYNAQGEIVSIEPVNALYVGSASVGPYVAGSVAMAGSTPAPYSGIAGPIWAMTANFTIGDAPSTCGDGTDGTAAAPMVLPVSGWWNGVVCGYGHASYVAVPVRPGRSLTVEVTALDADGFATTTKAMPVVGLFAATDAAGSLPSLGMAAEAFASMEVGTTALSFSSGATGGVVRVAIADQRGDGRPDFAYQARLFYADNVVPAVVASGAGSTVTMNGNGFRAGNVVTVNGVPATVVSWSSTAIVLKTPTMAAAGAVSGMPVDVVVTDLGTQASSTMTGALTYEATAALPHALVLVSAPTATMFVGDVATVPFAVRVVASDGVTPVAGDAVVFTAGGPVGGGSSAQFGVCGAASCSVVSDARGVASTQVTPLAAGTVSLKAADGAANVDASFQAEVKPMQMLVISAPSGDVRAGVAAATVFEVRLLKPGGGVIAGELINFSVTGGAATYGACDAAACSAATDASGYAKMVVTPRGVGPVTLMAADGSVTQTAMFVAVANQDSMVLLSAPGASGYVGDNLGQLNVRLLDGGGRPVVGVPVVFTAPAGVTWDRCGTSVCSVDTDWSGGAGANVSSTVAGTLAIQAGYAGLVVPATIQVAARRITLTVLSAPTGAVRVGTVAAVPFSVQLLDGWGNPMGGAGINLGGAQGQVTMGCGQGSCVLVADGNGVVSSTVMPERTGTIVLDATWGAMNVSSSFAGVGGVETLNVMLAPPANIAVGGKIGWTLQLLSADGVTPISNKYIDFSLTSGTLAIDQCQGGSCHYETDAKGLVAMTATAWVPGTVTWVAYVDELTQQTSFQVAANLYTLKVVSAPRGTLLVGATAPPFVVQLLGADGATPVAGQNVGFSVSQGSAQLAACAAMPCAIKTDARGIASTGLVTTTGVGAVGLLASQNALTASANFTVVPEPDQMTLVSAPANGSVVGMAASAGFSVRVMSPDGTTAEAGRSVLLTASGATLGVCGASSCMVNSDASGRATTWVTPLAAGTVTLEASEQGVGETAVVMASFSAAMPVVRSLNASPAQSYLAEGARAQMQIAVTAVQNGVPAAGQAVVWTGATDFVLPFRGSVTSSAGVSAMQASVGPMAAGVQATAQACAWGLVCTQFQVAGVSAGFWQIAIVSGGQQAARGGAALQPVVAQVTDGAGHPVLGATVTLGQSVTALDAACPVQGRCPAAAVLASSSAVLTSDASGDVWTTPLTVSGVATTTWLAFSTGVQGFATAQVSSTP